MNCHTSIRSATARANCKVAAATLAIVLAASGVPGASAQPAGPVEQRVAASLQRIEDMDQEYRAVIALDPQALATARVLDRQRRAPGRLHGEPILLKDNIESVGLPTTAGSLALAENDTGKDASLVSALRSEGAVILGKANLSEWANFRSEHSSSGWSAVGGQTRNAIDPLRTPCGSSSGSAVAVALGYVRVAIGTETSGSIICPASVNGVVGFKPTHGLVSGDGIVPLALTQDTAGPIAANVELAARTLAVMVDPAARDAGNISRGLLELDEVKELRGLRFGVFANTQGYDKRRDDNLARITAVLQAAGATVIPDLRIDPYDGYGADSYDVLLWEFRRDLNAYLAALPNPLARLSLDEIIRFNSENADRELQRFDQSIFLRSQALELTEEAYREKRERTQTAMRADGLDRLFEEHKLDALIGISTSVAWLIDWVNGDASFGRSMAGPAAVAGNPHVTLPLAEIEGLPHGISLVGERWKDHRLAAIARLVESAAAR